MIGRKAAMLLVLCVLILPMLAACEGGLGSLLPIAESVEIGLAAEDTGTSATAGTATESAVGSVADTSAQAGGTEAASVADALAQNDEGHDGAEEFAWDGSGATRIALDGDSAVVDGEGATADGSRVTITSAGSYSLTGSLADGQIVVDTEEDGTVGLVLSGVDIHCSTDAAIEVVSPEEVVIVLAEGTENRLSDGDSRPAEATDDEPNAALFSMADLTISGSGSLTVDGNYRDGIASKDGLIIAGGTLTVRSADDGIRGKDYLVVEGGTIAVEAQGDGLVSDNDVDAAKGYVLIEGGTVQVTAAGDGIQAATDVLIADGEITLSVGGGSAGRIDVSLSAKGIKAAVGILIDGGTFTIDSADDALNSNGSLVINGGTFVIATGDDGMHADSTLEINGGQIRIVDSYEGIESAVITLNDGEIRIVSSDDGLNVAGGADGSGAMQWPGGAIGLGQGGRPGRGGGPGQDAFAASGDYHLVINGGYIVIDANGDGLDSNGTIEMTDGVVIVNGPTQNMNGAVDYMGSFQISGGFLVAVGSAGMAEAPDQSSTQNSLLLNLSGILRAGTLLHIQSSDGREILTFSSTKQYQSIVLSSPELASGATYEVYYGGSSTGTAADGLYQGGTYSGGPEYTSFRVSSVVTRVGGYFR